MNGNAVFASGRNDLFRGEIQQGRDPSKIAKRVLRAWFVGKPDRSSDQPRKSVGRKNGGKFLFRPGENIPYRGRFDVEGIPHAFEGKRRLYRRLPIDCDRPFVREYFPRKKKTVCFSDRSFLCFRKIPFVGIGERKPVAVIV